MVEMGADEFEELVAEALEEIPDELMSLVDNCLLIVEDFNDEDLTLLGLYEGIPLTEREANFTGMLPDRIFVYRIPTLEMCRDADEVAEEVLTTVVHEIAHFFGINDERLHELGWA
ncbi:putative Zn-dependent protease with MMP-like domain [Luteococcus japonicus]|nr:MULTISPECIES: metallopeptidase family protein [Luteococcus]MDN5563476.1 metallopeptidase family protein [Luteococcus sp.]ROR54777.1 putative Zn-dependent protease with MMP-like domain [Luteococcus japonicus]